MSSGTKAATLGAILSLAAHAAADTAPPAPPAATTPTVIQGLSIGCSPDAAAPEPPTCNAAVTAAEYVAHAADLLNSASKLPPNSSPDVLRNRLISVDQAVVYYQCVPGMANAPTDIQARIGQANQTKAWLSSVFEHACGSEAQIAARRFTEETRRAATLDDAKAAASRVQAATSQAAAARDRLPDAGLQAIVDDTNGNLVAAQKEIALRNGADATICGKDEIGRPKSYCLTYGAFGATLSYLWTWNDGELSSRPRLASVVVPTVAVRWEPWSEKGVGWFALEFGAYTTFLTQALANNTPTASKVPCTQRAGDYEGRLPCEANGSVNPYLAGYFGATFGKSGIGFLTLSPLTFGVAQVGSRTALEPYVGVMVGALQFNGSL